MDGIHTVRPHHDGLVSRCIQLGHQTHGMDRDGLSMAESYRRNPATIWNDHQLRYPRYHWRLGRRGGVCTTNFHLILPHWHPRRFRIYGEGLIHHRSIDAQIGTQWQKHHSPDRWICLRDSKHHGHKEHQKQKRTPGNHVGCTTHELQCPTPSIRFAGKRCDTLRRILGSFPRTNLRNYRRLHVWHRGSHYSRIHLQVVSKQTNPRGIHIGITRLSTSSPANRYSSSLAEMLELFV